MAEESERIYTIPLRKKWLKAPRNKRAKKAVNTVRGFLFRHMHASDVKISEQLNKQMWLSGVQKPPAKIKIKAVKDENDVVTARLPDEKVIVKEEKKKGVVAGLKEKIAKRGEEKKPEKEEIKEELEKMKKEGFKEKPKKKEISDEELDKMIDKEVEKTKKKDEKKSEN